MIGACAGRRKAHVLPTGPMPRKRDALPGSTRRTAFPSIMSTQRKMMKASVTAKKVVKTGSAKSVFPGPKDRRTSTRVMMPQTTASPV